MQQHGVNQADYYRQRVVVEFKQSRALDGTCFCDVCSWVPNVRLHGGWTIYHGHHVVPVCWGGSLERDNLALLCPTCHTLAHFLFPRTRQRGAPKKWTGPQTPAQLVSQMREALGLAA